MKKLILVGALALFTAVNAQQVKFGLKAGMNVSTFTGDAKDAKSLVGFQAGAFAQVPISGKFTFQPEVLYSGQGAKGKEDGVTIKWTADYVNVPLMVSYNIAEKFNVEAGPQVGFLISSKVKGDGVSVDVKDSMKSVDFSLNVGASYDITSNILVGVRYGAGISNILKESDNAKVRNGVFQLSVGYKF